MASVSDLSSMTRHADLFTYSYLPACDGPLPQFGYFGSAKPAIYMPASNPLEELCHGPESWPPPRQSLTDGKFVSKLDPSPVQFSPLCRCPYATAEIICYEKDRWPEIAAYCAARCDCSRVGGSRKYLKSPPVSASVEADASSHGGSFQGQFSGTHTSRGDDDKVESSCGGTCTSIFGCFGEKKRAGCEHVMCRVEKAIHKGMFAIGVCSIVHTRRVKEIGGRHLNSLQQDDLACACNSTYVSRNCCWAEDGIVWEHEVAKLGELLLE